MKNIGIKYGLILGGICIVFFELYLALGKVPLGSGKLPELGFHLILVVAAMYALRMKQGNILYTWEALSVGYFTNLVATVLTTAFLWLGLKYFHIGLIDGYIKELTTMLGSHKTQHIEAFGQKSYTATLASIKQTNLRDIIVDDFIKKSVFMVIPIFIAALILRRKA
jgi:hypothetical protein